MSVMLLLPAVAPMVGRDDELGVLAQALAVASAGHTRGVLLAGEAGIGKTRLVTELAGHAAGDALVAVGHCVQLGREGAPYAPLIGALRVLLREVGVPDAASALGGGRGVLARLLPELGDGTDVAEAGRGRLFEAVARLLEHAARRRGVVVVLEDLHWADASTLEMLDFLVRSLCDTRVLFVLTYRSDEVDPSRQVRSCLAELERHPRVQRLTLHRLDRTNVGTLLGRLGVDEPPAAVVNEVYRRSDGNPFFIQQLAEAGAAGAGRLPATLRDLLLLRIEALPQQSLWVLKVAAVGGTGVSHQLLATVAAMPDVELDAALRAGVTAHVLVVDPDRQGYAFQHTLVREAVSDDVLPGERTRLHARWARALEKHPSGGAGSSVAVEIAHHWYEAGEIARAFTAALRAADETRDMCAPHEEMLMLERVLQLWDRVPDAAQQTGADRVSMLTRAAGASRRAGEPGRAASFLDTALRMVSPDDDPALHAHLLVTKAFTGSEQMSEQDVVALLDEALGLLPADSPSKDRAWALTTLAGVHMLHDHLSVELGEQACEAARLAGDLTSEATALSFLALVTCVAVDVEEGLVLFERCRRVAEESADDDVLLRYYTNLSDVLLGLARYGDAARVARDGRDRAQSRGLLRGWDTVLAANEAEALIALGAWDQAVQSIETALAQDPQPSITTHLLIQRAELMLHRGDPGAAQAIQALAQMPDRFAGQSQYALPVARTLAEAALGRGEPVEALHLLVDALRSIDSAHASDAWVFAHTMTRAIVAATSAGAGHDLVAECRDLLGQGREHFTRSVIQPAWDAVLDAELAAVDQDEACAANLWGEAASLVADPSFEGPALLRAYVGYRATRERVEAGDRPGASGLIRSVLEECHHMGAAPLEAAAADLARKARLPIEDAAPEPGTTTVARALGLTSREMDVLRLIAAGRSNAQIAADLFISPKTVSVHVSNILTKLDVSSRGEAAAKAHTAGLAV